MAFIEFLFLFCIAICVGAVVFFWRLYRRIHHAAEQLRQQMNGGNQTQKNQSARRTTTESGDTIIDSRSPEEASRKIFDKDEGEYVDYED